MAVVDENSDKRSIERLMLDRTRTLVILLIRLRFLGEADRRGLQILRTETKEKPD